MPHRESLFMPAVIVSDDGTITVDWCSSYLHTLVIDNGLVVDTLYDPPEDCDHVAKIDFITASNSTSQGLRDLADHIDAQEANRK